MKVARPFMSTYITSSHPPDDVFATTCDQVLAAFLDINNTACLEGHSPNSRREIATGYLVTTVLDH
jgi:hypothetical protein